MVIFILTIAKATSLYREGIGRNRVLEVMLRDGAFFLLHAYDMILMTLK